MYVLRTAPPKDIWDFVQRLTPHLLSSPWPCWFAPDSLGLLIPFVAPDANAHHGKPTTGEKNQKTKTSILSFSSSIETILPREANKLERALQQFAENKLQVPGKPRPSPPLSFFSPRKSKHYLVPPARRARQSRTAILEVQASKGEKQATSTRPHTLSHAQKKKKKIPSRRFCYLLKKKGRLGITGS